MLQKVQDCPLEKMIDFIMERNHVSFVQFIIYNLPDVDIDEYPGLHFDFFTDRERRLISSVSPHFLCDSFLPFSEGFYPNWIKELEKKFRKEKEENLGLTSRVGLENGEIKHIPMIDFRCPCSEENLKKVVKTLCSLGQKKGFIVESGKSYHFYGINLLNEKEWIDFINRCGVFGIIGNRWPFLQEKDGFSVLRISTSSKKPNPPKVVAKLGDFDF